MEYNRERSYFEERKTCPACSSENQEELYSISYTDDQMINYFSSFYGELGKIDTRYLTGELYILMRCENCRLVFQKFIPNGELMHKLYEEWIDPVKVHQHHLERGSFTLSYYISYIEEITALINYFNQLPQRLSFFDFGMGWGRWCMASKAMGVDTYGAELSETRCEHAVRNGIKVVAWNEIPEHKFSFINTEQVFEHVPNPLEILLHLKKGLASGGIVKISVPNGKYLLNKIYKPDWTAPRGSSASLNEVAPLEHINCFTYETIAKMAEMAGMTPIAGIDKFKLIKIDHTLGKFIIHQKESFKNLLRPIYWKLLRKGPFEDKGTYVFLKAK